jgi:hypothetical protein
VGFDRRHARVQVGVVAEADRETGDEPAPADAVEDRVLLGDPQRLPGLAERPPDDGERDVPAARGHLVGGHGGRQRRVRGHVVARLAVLGHDEAVEAQIRRGEHLVHAGREVLVHAAPVDEVQVRGHDDRLVAGLEVAGEMPIRILLERQHLHLACLQAVLTVRGGWTGCCCRQPPAPASGRRAPRSGRSTS